MSGDDRPARERFVVHLPILASDLPAARRFARAITRAVSFLADIDRAEATVSWEDAQGVHHRVFCDRLLGRGRRCPQPADHDGVCGSQPADHDRACGPQPADHDSAGGPASAHHASADGPAPADQDGAIGEGHGGGRESVSMGRGDT